jgi:hypothetical protein
MLNAATRLPRGNPLNTAAGPNSNDRVVGLVDGRCFSSAEERPNRRLGADRESFHSGSAQIFDRGRRPTYTVAQAAH